jgi:hypothetical protein
MPQRRSRPRRGVLASVAAGTAAFLLFATSAAASTAPAATGASERAEAAAATPNFFTGCDAGSLWSDASCRLVARKPVQQDGNATLVVPAGTTLRTGITLGHSTDGATDVRTQGSKGGIGGA